MSKITIRGIWHVMKQTGRGFMKDKIMKLSASLAYYTIFSLGPVMLVVIFFTNIFWGRQAIEGSIYGRISGMVGEEAALQIQQIIKNAAISGGSTTAAIISIATLLIGATSVFSEMQDSINTIWNLQVKADQGWKHILVNRLWSFAVVISLGGLLLISIIANTLLDKFMTKLEDIFPHVAFVAVYVVNLLMTFLVGRWLFAIIFKLLPDAVIQWKDVGVGAMFTGVLFMVGKSLITLYVNKTYVGNAYGAANSMVVLLVWVYFSSTILYFGAEFTKFYTLKYGSEIRPNDYAVSVQVIKVEKGQDSIQQVEREKEAADRKKP